jgi:quercetin dioxygenase-like cupin family protein
MKYLDTRAAAREARAAQADRPATTVLHDVPDARLLIFRIAPGQAVPPHTSTSTVILTVLEGTGTVIGGAEERAVSVGDVIIYEPNELHGMRAAHDTFVLLATITPRPGTR